VGKTGGGEEKRRKGVTNSRRKNVGKTTPRLLTMGPFGDSPEVERGKGVEMEGRE